jgi:energy-coupling factor transport system ATP-binding protein
MTSMLKLDSEMGPLIDFDHVSFRYVTAQGPEIPALRDLSLSIAEGEFVAVVGANGSGKSTFARLVSALLLPDEGVVRLDGLDTRRPENRARIHTKVGMVFQFPEDQVISTTVQEDVAFGPENMALPPEEIRSRVEAALREVNLWEMRNRSPHLLSAGQTQRLALAGVLAMRPRCIVFDEASTMLDPSGRIMLLEAMQRLNREGITIILITHFMEEAAMARRMVVLNHGQVALDGTPAEVFADQDRLTALRLDLPPAVRAAAAVRASLPDFPEGLLTPAQVVAALPDFPGPMGGVDELSAGREEEARPIIEVSGLGFTYMRDTPLAQRALDNVDLRVGEGQVHGLIGMTGSGKSTLMQHLNALLYPQEGQVRVAEFNLSDAKVDRRQVVRKVGLVFQNPEMQFFEHFTGDEIAYGPRQLKIEETLADRVRWAMEQVGLDFATYKDRPLFTLSGGERRKVALASTLALKPDILLLDEPTAGLDPASRRDLLDKLLAMRDSGLTLVLSSHQMGDLARLARSLTVFSHGHNVLSGPTVDVFEQRDALREYGLEAPVAAQVVVALRARGWPLPQGIMTAEALQVAVAQALQGVVR